MVVASIESGATLASAVERLLRACQGLDAEIFIVDASRDDALERMPTVDPAVRTIRRAPGTIAPTLWAEGIRASRGRCVALSTGHCLVPESWARSLTGAIGAGAGAAGAGLEPAPGLRATDLAVFFLRYQRFLPITRGPVRQVEDVPGDNAAYAGDAVRAWNEDHPDGFFEVEYHEELRGAGTRITAVPEATALFGRAFPLTTILRHRFAHGRQFGAHRVTSGGESRWSMAVKAPVVPFVLLLRTARTVGREGRLAGALTRSLAHFLLIAASWALGEATGALLGEGTRRHA